MATKKEHVNLVRWSCILTAFTDYYFMKIIVVYLLAQGVTPWVAVSIPIVMEFARIGSRGINFIVNLALKLNYKKYHIFHLIAFLLLGLIISQCTSVYTIYFFTLVSGVLSGIKHSTVTKFNTSNKKYEPYCFIEEERASVIGGTLGLIVSQLVYDFSPIAYVLGYVILIILGTFLSLFLKDIPVEDVMIQIDDEKILDKKEKKNTVFVSLLFAILAGCWCLGLGAFTELAPLISDKIGYLSASSTIIEFILLCLLPGAIILRKITKRKKLLFTETICACIDTFSLLIAALTLSWQGLLIAYIITGITAVLSDPVWGSIISEYSTNSRQKYVIVNKVYFIIRAIFLVITWFICRECVIRGIESFAYLAIVLLAIIIIVYIISDRVNKNVFGSSI